MGTFFHPITLISPSGGRETLEALVDTGSTFSSFPRSILERLDVQPRRKVRLRLANRKLSELDVGLVEVELDGVRDFTFCTFGEPESPAVIGAVTLEVFQFGVDPGRKKLVPSEGWRV